MRLAKKVKLQPTKRQEHELRKHAAARRWAWNWGLECKEKAWKERKAQIDSGTPKDKCTKVPSAFGLSNMITPLISLPESEGGTWWKKGEINRCAPVSALRDLEQAFGNMFGGSHKRPRFQGYRQGHGGFKLFGSIVAKNQAIKLPTIGYIRITPGQHGYIPPGKIKQIQLTQRAGQWYASTPDMEVDEMDLDDTRPIVGIDRGVSVLIALSDGTVCENPKALKKYQRKHRRLCKAISRKVGGSKKVKKSNNCKKAIAARNRLEERISNLRDHAINKATKEIAKKYSVIVLEDLQLKNMTRKAKGKGKAAKSGLNKSILDSCLGKIRQQLEYKALLYGSRIEYVKPHYTSQMCSVCGCIDRANRKSQAVFKCVGCGYEENADFNASKNIRNLFVAGVCPETQSACGEDVSPVGIARRQTSVKQESVPSGT